MLRVYRLIRKISFLCNEWNSLGLGGPAHGIVTETMKPPKFWQPVYRMEPRPPPHPPTTPGRVLCTVLVTIPRAGPLILIEWNSIDNKQNSAKAAETWWVQEGGVPLSVRVNAVMTLVTLFSLNTMVSLQNGLQTYFGATPLCNHSGATPIIFNHP